MSDETNDPVEHIDMDANGRKTCFVFNFETENPDAYVLLLINGKSRAVIHGDRIYEVNHG